MTANGNGRPAVLVGIGASAGGVRSLRELVSALPISFPGAVIVVLHRPANAAADALTDVLARTSTLPTVSAQDGMPVRAGTVIVAPPDRHLLVRRHTIALESTDPRDGHRPSVDLLLESLATAAGTGAVGVILSGALDDGADGMDAIKQAGGTTIVQDPLEALHPSMIHSAQARAAIDAVLPLAEIPTALSTLAAGRALQRS